MRTRSELYQRLGCYLVALGFVVLGCLKNDAARLAFLIPLFAIAVWDCGIIFRRIRSKIFNQDTIPRG